MILQADVCARLQRCLIYDYAGIAREEYKTARQTALHAAYCLHVGSIAGS